MRTIVRMRFGSHLYGTQTPASDLDFKSVFVPDARSILLQRAKETQSDQRVKAMSEKNFAGEVDEERFGVQKFLKLISEGQTVALDMLFAPPWAWVGPPSPEWIEIQANRDRLLTRRASAFVGYARQQANRYGIRGSRVAASRAALALLERGVERFGSTAKLGALAPEIAGLLGEHSALSEDPNPTGAPITLWEVCNRKMPFTATIKSARDIMARVVAEYGRRALMAETQQGVDWKALSHAVRVARQALELLASGRVAFPRPDAADLIAIKTGQRLYQDVAAEIERLLEEVEAAALQSALPEVADLVWIDGFVARVHRQEVLCDAV